MGFAIPIASSLEERTNGGGAKTVDAVRQLAIGSKVPLKQSHRLL